MRFYYVLIFTKVVITNKIHILPNKFHKMYVLHLKNIKVTTIF